MIFPLLHFALSRVKQPTSSLHFLCLQLRHKTFQIYALMSLFTTPFAQFLIFQTIVDSGVEINCGNPPKFIEFIKFSNDARPFSFTTSFLWKSLHFSSFRQFFCSFQIIILPTLPLPFLALAFLYRDFINRAFDPLLNRIGIFGSTRKLGLKRRCTR